MRLILQITHKEGFPLDGPDRAVFEDEGCTLGRAETNDLTLPDSERFISNRHAHVEFREDIFTLVDTSSNGVYLSGSSEPIGKNNTAILGDGDSFVIGGYELKVSIDEGERAVEPIQEVYDDGPKPALVSSWGAWDTSSDSSGLLDGERETDAPSFAPWGESHVGSSLLEPSSQRPSTEPDHSPFGQQHFVPPVMESEDGVPSWDRTGFTYPPASEQSDSKGGDRSEAGGGGGQARSSEGVVAPTSSTDVDEVDNQDSNFLGVMNWESLPAAVMPVKTNTEGSMSASEQNRPSVEGLSVEGGVDAVKLFLDSAGLNKTEVLPEDVPALMGMLGGLYREIVQDVMDVLRARSELKNEFRMRHTQINIAENNPLKFSVSIDEALEHLIFHRSENFLSPEAAFMEAFHDIKDHQVAMMAGMKSTFDSVLRRFDPELLEQRVTREKKIGHRLPVTKKANCWEQYEVLYGDLVAAAEDDFLGLFGDEFTRAYEEQIARLSMLRKDS